MCYYFVTNLENNFLHNKSENLEHSRLNCVCVYVFKYVCIGIYELAVYVCALRLKLDLSC